jgi:UDP-N-acetylmuramate dehydrogenase
MIICKNISLKKYNTFGLDYSAECLIRISSIRDAVSIFKKEKILKKPLLITGRGSNLLFISDFKGTIIRPEFSGIKVEEETGDTVLISSGAGVKWDKLVEWSVYRGYGGLENLSLIPGTVGASAVQNIGAYGAEVGNVIEKVKAISTEDGSLVEFSSSDCIFGYRNSIFKSDSKGKYLIIKVYYKLSINPLLKLDYGSLNEEIKKLGEPSLSNVRKAVINIRRSKLPDPAVIGNAGSFFKNPVVPESLALRLLKECPDMPQYSETPGCKKLAAGWLIEKCGWKGKRIGDAGVHDRQALVIVNHGKATGKEIYDLSESIRKSVNEMFGVNLEREVEVVGTI